ncbi:MAG TPA: sialate O-acetylesterase [Puia sp.]|nr:sialate O-acetylesterase [Puia sp.]
MKKIWCFFACSCYAAMSFADVRLPKIFGDDMVLQRDKPCAIWGMADKKEKISVTIEGVAYATVAGNDGKWKVILPAHAAGGPYQLSIKGKNTVLLNNVLFGDVWVCGGQSNMQFRVSELAYKETDSVHDNNSRIRIFTAGLGLDYVPQDTLTGGQWKVASVASIQSFSAVAWFFGRYVQEHTGVPVGLISDNLGATSVEEWMSPEALHAFPQFEVYYREYLAGGQSFSTMTKAFEKMKPEWEKNYYKKDDPGFEQQWYLPGTDTSGWKTMELPGYWEDKGLADYNGSVWFRRSFDVPVGYKKEGMWVGIGQVDDYDITYVNGHKVGESFGNQNYRNYFVPDSLLKPAGNTVVVRVFDAGGKGGIYTQFWSPQWGGKWQYKPGIKIDAAHFVKPHVVNAYLFGTPSILYNGCIAPITQLAIKGVIWYQGEGNAGRAEEYRQLFPAMITDWRKQFGQGNFPFLFVQLANYYPEATVPGGSTWAELREAQEMTLKLPNTGVATAIDIGDANDIHPKNKMDVGRRLGIAAMKVAYGQDSVHVSPMYDHMENRGDSIAVFFSGGAEELVTHNKYGYVSGFSIAGADSVFHWARAYIKGNGVVVYSPDVRHPVAVRYAWADNPGQLDLYNRSGLPALPFRTDDWPGVTAGKQFDVSF